MIQLPKDSGRTAYGWGLIMLYEVYFQSFAQAMAALAPDPMLASLLFSLLFSFVIVFSGVAQPAALMPSFWRPWMFPLSPFTHLIEGMLGDIYLDKPIRCSDVEFNVVVPPTGQTCDRYMSGFSSRLDQPAHGTGYYEVMRDADGSERCAFCQYRTGEDFMATVGTNNFSFSPSHRFRVIGIVIAFTVFNVFLTYGLFYIARIHRWHKQKVVPPAVHGNEDEQPVGSPQTQADIETKLAAKAGEMTFGPQLPVTGGANAAITARSQP